jgi:hypothetical protein
MMGGNSNLDPDRLAMMGGGHGNIKSDRSAMISESKARESTVGMAGNINPERFAFMSGSAGASTMTLSPASRARQLAAELSTSQGKSTNTVPTSDAPSQPTPPLSPRSRALALAAQLNQTLAKTSQTESKWSLPPSNNPSSGSSAYAPPASTRPIVNGGFGDDFDEEEEESSVQNTAYSAYGSSGRGMCVCKKERERVGGAQYFLFNSSIFVAIYAGRGGWTGGDRKKRGGGFGLGFDRRQGTTASNVEEEKQHYLSKFVKSKEILGGNGTSFFLLYTIKINTMNIIIVSQCLPLSLSLLLPLPSRVTSLR